MTVRHFGFLPEDVTDELFSVAPQPFDRHSDPSVLALALGATLYSPGTRISLSEDAHRAASIGATSQVWCLEDSIAHREVPAAQANIVAQLKQVHAQAATGRRFPLLFVRVRSARQIRDIARGAGTAIEALTGFVLPKFTPDRVGASFLDEIETQSDFAGLPLYGLPVLEHPELAWTETRGAHLAGIRALLDSRRRHVLSVRVGAADLCGLFGLRRDSDTTIWDVAVVRDMLGDIINQFARRGDYVVSGPVWEHFAGDRLFKPQLRATPFEVGGRSRLRTAMVDEDHDELVREVSLDRANGFTGKTVIHPTHVCVVNTLATVAREEHDDALAIVSAAGQGGALRSTAGTRMNEIGPHALWAQQVLARAAVYGVLAGPGMLVNLLERGRAAADAAYRSPAGSPVAGPATR